MLPILALSAESDQFSLMYKHQKQPAGLEAGLTVEDMGQEVLCTYTVLSTTRQANRSNGIVWDRLV